MLTLKVFCVCIFYIACFCIDYDNIGSLLLSAVLWRQRMNGGGAATAREGESAGGLGPAPI